MNSLKQYQRNPLIDDGSPGRKGSQEQAFSAVSPVIENRTI
jgi:hypothetical protein